MSFLPAEAEPDWEAWKERMALSAAERRESLAAAVAAETGQAAVTAPVTVPVAEAEPPGTIGANDLPAFGEAVPGFGSAPGEAAEALLTGDLLPGPESLPPAPEPDGSIPQATFVPLTAGLPAAVKARIGDGPFGSGEPTPSGDFDFYRLTAAPGERIEVAVRTPEPTLDLDPVAALYDAAGQLVAVNDDVVPFGLRLDFDSYLRYVPAAGGDFYALVGGHGPGGDVLDMLPEDPFDAASGPGAASEGKYEVIFGLDAGARADVDFFRLELRAGDVVGATVTGGADRLALHGPDGASRVAARLIDASGVYPDASRLPGGGRAALAAVVEEAGTWALGVDLPPSFDRGAYSVEVRVLRAPLGGAEPARQVLFVDFDGATIDPGIFPGFLPGFAHLTPLAAFLPRWGLAPTDEDAVIDAVLAVVEEKLSADVRARGGNGDFGASGLAGDFDIELRNSRDHPDPFGLPHVSRIVVGGTIDELGQPTLGIAQSADVGNQATAETAVVLLDLLSGPAPDPNSLASIPRAPGVSLIELIGRGVGTIAAHEAGHLFGDFHTRRDGGLPNVMDRGGDLPHLVGVGPDGVFGSGDDDEVDLGPDDYEPAEGFRGVEETLEVVSFGLPAGGDRQVLTLRPAGFDFGAVAVGASASAGFSVSNPGNLPLAVAEAQILGPGAPSFTVVSGGAPFAVSPAETHPLVVRFLPSAAGPWSATLRLASDDPARPELLAPLAGQGGVPAAGLSPTAHDFGAIVYGAAGQSVSHTFEVANAGPGDLVVSDLVFVSGDAPRFTVDAGDAPFMVAPGGLHEITVSFRPGGLVGDMETLLRAVGNDPASPWLDAALSGEGIGPDVDVDPPSPYQFGTQALGVTRFRDFRVANLGQLDLDVTSSILTGMDPAEFTIASGGAPFTLASGEVRPVRVLFHPTSVGGKEARLVLDSNDPDEAPLTIELRGAGAVPEIEIEPLELDFGTLPTGDQAELAFVVRNVGFPRLTVSSIALAGGGQGFEIVSGGQPVVLASGGEWPVSVRFRPTGPGFSTDAVEVVSDAPEAPLVSVILRGEGVAMELRIEKACSAEGGVTCTLAVYNLGPSDAVDVEVTDELPAELAWVADGCGAGPPAGAVLTWAVPFLPGTGEAQECTLQLEALPGAPNTLTNRAAVAGPFTQPGGFEDEAFATFELLGPREIPALSRVGLVVLALLLAVAGVRLRH